MIRLATTSRRSPASLFAPIITALALLVGATTSGCDSSAKGSATGTILPVQARATVSVYRDGEWVSESRANLHTGDFSLDLPPGSYEIVASATGYLDATRSVDVTEGHATDLGTIGLYRQGAGNIHGKVSPATAQATVSAVVGGAALAQATTDATGDFLLASVPVGAYDLVVNAPGFARNASTTGVVVTEANTTEVPKITLQPLAAAAGSLSGMVLPTGIGAQVTVMQGGALVTTAVVDSSGAYRVTDLAPGTYDLVAAAPTYGTDASRMGVMVQSGSNTSVPTVTLVRPTRTVEGTVVAQEGAVPLAGVVVRIGTTQATSDTDGHFVLVNPPSGPQTLRAERAFYRSMDIPVNVAASGTTRLPITLAAVGEVAGTIRVTGTESPLANAQVSIGDAVGWTDSAGRFRLTGVALGNGRYSVTAPGYVPLSGSLTVVRGAVTPLDLHVVPGYAVSGQVRDSVGPIAGAVVSVAGQVTSSAADGSFSFAAVPTGSQPLTASAPDYVTTSTSVSSPASGVMVTLVAAAKVTVTGTVKAGTPAAPVANAYVSIGNASTSTNASGVYTLLNVPVTRTQIQVSAYSSPYQTYTGTLALSSPGPVTVDVTLLPYARVTGHVTELVSGQGIAGIPVSCGSGTTTDGSGAYAVDRVPSSTSNCVASGDTCHSYQFQPIVVAPGSAYTLDFALSRNPDLTVIVRDAVTHAPLPGASLTLVSSVVSRTQSTTDGSGQHIFSCQTPGSPVVFAAAPGYVDTSVAITLVADTPTSVTVELMPQSN